MNGFFDTIFEKYPDANDEKFFGDVMKFSQLLAIYKSVCLEKKSITIDQELDWPLFSGLNQGVLQQDQPLADFVSNFKEGHKSSVNILSKVRNYI